MSKADALAVMGHSIGKPHPTGRAVVTRPAQGGCPSQRRDERAVYRLPAALDRMRLMCREHLYSVGGPTPAANGLRRFILAQPFEGLNVKNAYK